jgi:hypothetical protein
MSSVEGPADQHHHLWNELGSRGSGPTAESARMSHEKGQPQGEGTKGTICRMCGGVRFCQYRENLQGKSDA